MKVKKIFAGLVLAFGLMFMPMAAHAQYTNPTESQCNMTYGNGGIPKTINTMVVNVFIHYSNSSTDTEKAQMVTMLIEDLNRRIQKDYPGSQLVFKETTDEDNFNIKINLSLYQDASGVYVLFLEARGMGVGHLFRFNRNDKEVGDLVVNSFEELALYFQNGWSCEAGE